MSISKFFNTDKFNLQQVVTPCIGTKTHLLVFRIVALAVLLYGFVVSIYNYYFNFKTNELRVYLPYFTHQTFICILFYFGFNIYFQIKDRKKALPFRFEKEACNVFCHISFNALVPMAFLVSIIFWGIIYPVLDFSRCNYLNYVQHIILHCFQSIFLGIDWFLISIPTCSHHYLPMFIIGIVYLTFANIYHAITGNWIYDFVDTTKDLWVVTYVAVTCFWFAFGYGFTVLHQKKNKLTSEKFGQTVKGSNGKNAPSTKQD